MYIIQDWAGNILFNSQTFPDFDSAWDYIYMCFPDEEDFEDYYVMEFAGIRESNYLDPNDIRASRKAK